MTDNGMGAACITQLNKNINERKEAVNYQMNKR